MCTKMIFVKLVVLVSTSITLIECEECRDTVDNSLGVCREAQQCGWAINLIKNKKRKPNEFKTCGFNGIKPIICCKEEIPPEPNNVFLRKAAQACEQIRNLRLLDPPNIDFHIIAADPVEPGEFPHQVALGYSDAFDINKTGYYCGGSLISKDFVLTAAHCVNSRERQPKTILLGKTSLDLHEDDHFDGFKPKNVGIKAVILHPSFTSRRKYDDIALIQLATPIDDYTKVLKPACLSTHDLEPGQQTTVTGWGTVDVDTRATSNWLMKANLTEVPLSDCRAKYALTGLSKIPENLRDTQMCATGLSRSGQVSDACQGDSGGPLNYKLVSASNNVTYYTVVGVTSFGASCGSNIPGVYTRVNKYLDWIESKVWPTTVEI